MNKFAFQKDFPERFEVVDKLDPKRVGRRVLTLKAFCLLVTALGPIFLVLAYFAVPEGGNFFADDECRGMLMGV